MKGALNAKTIMVVDYENIGFRKKFVNFKEKVSPLYFLQMLFWCTWALLSANISLPTLVPHAYLRLGNIGVFCKIQFLQSSSPHNFKMKKITALYFTYVALVCLNSISTKNQPSSSCPTWPSEPQQYLCFWKKSKLPKSEALFRWHRTGLKISICAYN